MFARRLFALALVIVGSLTSGAAQEIKTPLQLVPLWSQEMLDYVMGNRQAACSGKNAPACERLNSGVCDDTAYFRLGSTSHGPEIPFRPPPKQTDTTKPQYFRLELRNAGYGSGTFDVPSAELKALELVLNCSFSGNDGCPANRFQTGAVKRVLVSLRDGAKAFDLTSAATVLPDGPIVVPIDGTLKAFLLQDTSRTYQVRVVSECFSVAPSPIEWTLPVYPSPAGSESVGAIIVRVMAGSMTFAHRRAGGQEVPFEPDWMAADWGYTFLMEQTILDRKGEWFLLPSRPFETPVWIHLPNRHELSEVETGVVYTLAKSVKALPKGSRRPVAIAAGKIVVVNVQGRVVEIRKEQTFDQPCEDGRTAKRTVQTYAVDIGEFYDFARHLQLQPAYVKGC
jgi:hypothetical protein